MASLQQIISWFQTGLFPTSDQFRQTWLSYWHKSEKIPQSQVFGLQETIESATRGLIYQNPVTNVADLYTTYPNAKVGWAAMVTSEGYIYSYNGTAWANTGLKEFPEDVATKEDINQIENDLIYSGIERQTVYVNPVDAKIGDIFINDYVTSVIVESTDYTVPLAGDLYISGYIRSSGQGFVVLNWGNLSLNLFPTSFRGTFTLNFQFEQFIVRIQFTGVPDGLFPASTYFNKALFDPAKLIINEYTVVDGVTYNKNDINYAQNPAWTSNNAYKYMQFPFSDIDKKITLQYVGNSLAITNRAETALYPALITDFSHTICLLSSKINRTQVSYDISSPVTIIIKKGTAYVEQNGKIIFSQDWDSTTDTGTVTVGCYVTSSTPVVLPYVRIDKLGVSDEFYDRNKYLHYDKLSGEKINTNVVVDLDKGYEFQFDSMYPNNERLFKSYGGEVVSGTFGDDNCVYRIPVKLFNQYRIKMRYQFTEKLRSSNVPDSFYMMRTGADVPTGGTPNREFSISINKDETTLKRLFLRGYGNYRRELTIQDTGSPAFSVRYTGSDLSSGVGYTVTLTDTNFILKKGVEVLLNVTLSNYVTQHDFVKTIIDAAIPDVYVHVNNVDGDVVDLAQLAETKLIQQVAENERQVNTNFPVFIYQRDSNEHTIEVYCNPNTYRRFYYKYDGDVIFPIDTGVTITDAPYEDYIYFGGHGDVAAPMRIKSIKICGNVEQDEPKIIVLMAHGTADEVETVPPVSDAYYHFSNERLWKLKKLMDGLGYTHTPIADIRDYAMHRKPIPHKAWCIIFDDQQANLWIKEGFRKACFNAGIRPVTALITGWITEQEDKDIIKKSVGNGWEYVSHTNNHNLGTTCSTMELIDSRVQEFWNEVFGENCSIVVYPQGASTQNQRDYLVMLGYRLGITTNSDAISPISVLPMQVRRLNAGENVAWDVLETSIRNADSM